MTHTLPFLLVLLAGAAHAATVSVTVTDRDGNPVPDAVVVVVPSTPGSPRQQHQEKGQGMGHGGHLTVITSRCMWASCASNWFCARNGMPWPSIACCSTSTSRLKSPLLMSRLACADFISAPL